MKTSTSLSFLGEWLGREKWTEADTTAATTRQQRMSFILLKLFELSVATIINKVKIETASGLALVAPFRSNYLLKIETFISPFLLRLSFTYFSIFIPNTRIDRIMKGKVGDYFHCFRLAYSRGFQF